MKQATDIKAVTPDFAKRQNVSDAHQAHKTGAGNRILRKVSEELRIADDSFGIANAEISGLDNLQVANFSGLQMATPPPVADRRRGGS